MHATDVVPSWHEPGFVGKLPFIGKLSNITTHALDLRLTRLAGPTLNVMYNWTQQKLTYASVGLFLADHLVSDKAMRQKRVCILEDWKKHE